MSGHTPGPWTVEADSLGFPTKVTAQGFYGSQALIARTFGVLSNARLIAAAPELLEACKRLVERAAEDNPDDWAFIEAEAAIAKAEGK